MLGTPNKRHTEALCAMCGQNMFVSQINSLCTYVHASVYVRSPDISFWVGVLAALVVRLTRVKPSSFKRGLTPQLSCGLCVWGRLTFWPSPHVRTTELLRAAGGQLKPERVSLLLQICLARAGLCFYSVKHPSRHELISVSNASSFSAASPSGV